MAELVRGSVTDRPWGRTLAAFGLRAVTGQLTVAADGKDLHVAFGRGAVIAAASPLASDAAVRVALTCQLVSSSQVPEIARRLAAEPAHDEIDLVADDARLTPEQALRLRRRVIAQRAARTFSFPRGSFVMTDEIALPIFAGCELDVRAIIYMGARANLSEQRLTDELAQLGAWFRLPPASAADLPQFGFTDLEHAVLDRLRGGGTLAEIEADATRFVDARTVRAVLYALASCNACELLHAQPRPVSTGSAPARGRATPSSPPAPEAARPPGAQRQPSSASSAPVARAESPQARAVQELITQRLALLDRGCDHFQLLGVAPDVAAEVLRQAYFALARQLHPDRLAALGIPDEGKHAQRLFAQINAGFAILSDPARRAEYLGVLRRGGEAAVRAEQARAEELAQRILLAEDAFRRGDLALRRGQPQAAIADLARAVQLHPDEADYHALLAWAQFCAADDKRAVAAATRRTLEQAIERAPRSVTARFYLGRVERMLGRDPDALRHFRDVLAAAPGHAEAAAEVRVLEARLGEGGSGSGLFGRLKR